ncbi:MAG: hypothetical protein LBV28_01125, partial [Puniceicoccales bacterium]|nr:hypothetical protein [Puniceicoccales bacterium]
TVAQYAASIFLNDNALPYSGKVFERIMVSTYKGLAFLELQDVEKARVEFNRTRDWQSDAIERFSKEIAKEEEAVAKAKQENAVNTDAVLKDIRFKEEHVNVPNFIPYGDFINPFASYLAGLSALLENDFTKAVDLLKETSGMVPENKQVARDYALAKAGAPVKNQVWIIIENGLCPKLEEVKIAYMFPVPGERGFLPVSVFLTFPKLVNRPTAQEQFHIGADGNNYLAETVCDFNRVSRTEFNKTIAAVTTREIIRASVKAVAQYAANRAAEKQPAWARLAVAATGTIVAYATAGADTRQWTTLPANIQILALSIPADRKIHIRANTGETTVDIPACRNAILYYRVPTTLKTAALPHVIPLK